MHLFAILGVAIICVADMICLLALLSTVPRFAEMTRSLMKNKRLELDRDEFGVAERNLYLGRDNLRIAGNMAMAIAYAVLPTLGFLWLTSVLLRHFGVWR